MIPIFYAISETIQLLRADLNLFGLFSFIAVHRVLIMCIISDSVDELRIICRYL